MDSVLFLDKSITDLGFICLSIFFSFFLFLALGCGDLNTDEWQTEKSARQTIERAPGGLEALNHDDDDKVQPLAILGAMSSIASDNVSNRRALEATETELAAIDMGPQYPVLLGGFIGGGAFDNSDDQDSSNCHGHCPPGPPGPPGPSGPPGPPGPSGPPGPGAAVCPFTASQIVYVNKCGSDITGDGTFLEPYLTIGFAMSVIIDASSSKRYEIKVGPGTYAENVSLKANVFIQGSAPILTRINSIDLNDSSWTVDDDNRSGLENLQVLGNTTVDFVTTQSHQGKLYVLQSRLSGDVDYSACNSINELLLYNCELQSNLTQTGGDTLWYSSTIFGDVTIHDQTSAVNPIPNQEVDTRFFGSGGGSVLPLDGSSNMPSFTVLNDIPSPNAHTIQVDLAGFAVSGSLTITGDGTVGDTIVYASATGVPSEALTFVTNSGTLNLVNFANAIGYVPETPSNWALPLPETVQEALDRISDLLFTLNGSTPIP